LDWKFIILFVYLALCLYKKARKTQHVEIWVFPLINK